MNLIPNGISPIEYFREVFEHSPIGMEIYDKNGILIRANHAALEMYGVKDPHQIVGFDLFNDPYTPSDVIAQIRNGEVFEYVTSVNFDEIRRQGVYETDKQGEIFVACNVTPLTNTNQENIGFLLQIRDITELKKAQEKLKKSEARYHSIFESSMDGIVLLDSKGIIIEANEATSEIYGYSSDELVGMNASKLIRSDMHEFFEQIIGRGKEVLAESIDVRKDGSTFPTRVAVSPLELDGKGYVVAIIREITKEKEAAELREKARVYAEKKLEAFMESAPGIFAIFDENLDLVEINRGGLQLSPEATTKAELTGKNIVDLFPNITEEKLSIYRNLLEDGGVHSFDESELMVEGKKHVFETTAFNVNGGIGIVSIDVTDRVQAHDMLQESEELFHAVFDNSPFGIAVINEQGVIVQSNKALHDILGYSAEELSDMPLPEFTHPNDTENGLKLYHQLMRGQIDSYSLEKRYITKDGRAIWGKFDISLVRDSDQNPAFSVAMFENITKRKQAELQLERLNEELEERIEMRTQELKSAQKQLLRNERLTTLGKISGEVGHELRNPLGAMKNALYLLDMILENPDPDVEESLEILNDEIANCEKIVSSLLDYARPKELQKKKINVPEIVEESISKLDIPESIKIDNRLRNDLPILLGDPEKLKQVFTNLIKNAYQSISEKGHIKITSDIHNDMVEISVIDDGKGMNEETQAMMFEPLFSTKTHGIGLGMDIVKRIIESHDGEVSVDSELDIGTEVKIKLPINRRRSEEK